MADEQLIKPRELPAATTVFADDAIMTDNGSIVGKATPVQIVNAGAPVPTEAEAIAGTDNNKRMTPLTVKQVLDSVTAPSVLRAAAWAESDSPPDPGIPGSQSAKSWAAEAKSTAEIMEKASQQDQYSLTLSAGQTLIDEDADGNPIIVTDVADVYIDGFLLSPGVDYDINGSGHPVLLKEWDAGKVVRVNLIPNYSSPTSKSTATPPSASLRFFAAEPYDSVEAVLSSKQVTTELNGQRIYVKGGLSYDVVSSGGDIETSGGAKLAARPAGSGRVTLEQLGVDLNGVEDAFPLIQSAVEKGLRLFTGPGEMYISQPIKPTRGNPTFSLHGPARPSRSETDTAGMFRINAATGLVENTDGDSSSFRRILDIERIHVSGASEDTYVGVKGSFGGAFRDSRIINFNQLINNGYSYLLDISGNYFNRSAEGVILGDTNSTRVVANHFDSRMGRHFSNWHGASKNSFPLIFMDNNFNFGDDYTGGVWLCDNLIGTGNYFEKFGDLTKSTPLVTYVGRRFTYPSLIWEGNDANGQNEAALFMRILSDSAQGTSMRSSRVKGNWVNAFTDTPIEIGGETGFYGGVSGIDFGGSDGNAFLVPGVKYQSGDSIVRPDTAQLSFSAGGLEFTGTSWVSIPFNTVVGSMRTEDAPASAGKYPMFRRGKGYIVQGSVTVATTADVRNAEMRLAVDGNSQGSIFSSIRTGIAGGDNFETIPFSFYVPAQSSAVPVRLQVRNGVSGARVHSARMTVREVIDSEGFVEST